MFGIDINNVIAAQVIAQVNTCTLICLLAVLQLFCSINVANLASEKYGKVIIIM